MTIDDELLIAFADGECSDAERAEVERALADDPALRERLEQHRRVAARMAAHYAPMFEAPVPDRLAALLHKQQTDVIDFAAARENRQQRRRLPGWGQWGAIAASLAVGILVGQLTLSTGGPVESRQGALMARGELAEALDVQLASAPEEASGVRIGVPFRNQSGQFCRSFAMKDLSGIGCRSDDGWRLPVTHATSAAQSGGGYRQAASGDSLVLQAATGMMSGTLLDAATERKVRDNGWR